MKTQFSPILAASLRTIAAVAGLTLLVSATLLARRASMPKAWQAPPAPYSGPAIKWDQLPVYGKDVADGYGFHRMLANGVQGAVWGVPFPMDFGYIHILGAENVDILHNDRPMRFGLEAALTLNTAVGETELPTLQFPVPGSPKTHLVCQLWDLKANRAISEQDARILSFQEDNNLVSGLIDRSGNLHLNGRKGGVFTIKAAYDLPRQVFQNLGRYETRVSTRQDK